MPPATNVDRWRRRLRETGEVTFPNTAESPMIAFVAAAGVIAFAIAMVAAEQSLAIWILAAILAILGACLIIAGIELVRTMNTPAIVTDRGLTGPNIPNLPWHDIVRVYCSWRMSMGMRKVLVVITADAFNRLNAPKPAWLRAWYRIASFGWRNPTRTVTWLYRPTDSADDIVAFLTAELADRTRPLAPHRERPGAIAGSTSSVER